MNVIDTDNKEQFLQLLESEFAARLSADLAQQLTRFSREYFEAVPVEEIRYRRLVDIYGALVASWQFLQQHKPDQPKIRVFNPDLETHGWQSPHTVVVILHRNIPFLLDSIRMELKRQGLTAHTILHGVIGIDRDADGKLQSILSKDSGCPADQREALMYFEIDHHTDAAELEALRTALEQVLAGVRAVAEDSPKIQQHLQTVTEQVGAAGAAQAEAAEFLQWMQQGHFQCLGYEQFELVKEGEQLLWQLVEGSQLGLRQDDSVRALRLNLAQAPSKVRERLLRTDTLIFAKSLQRSTVHRPVHIDLVLVKRFNEAGEVIGAHSFLGLYNASASQQSPRQIPFVRHKVAAVLERSGLADDSARELEQILASYPRDEILQIETEELYNTALSVLNIQERQQIRLFLREDVFGRFVSALVYIPRDRYTAELRAKISNLLAQELSASDVEFVTYFSESVLARTLFTLRVDPVEQRVLNERELEDQIRALAQSWQDGLRESLVEAFGEEQAGAYFHCYQNAFPRSYQDNVTPRLAALDIGHMASLSEERRLAMSFYRALEEADSVLHLKLFNPDSRLLLSDVLPMFENLGLRVMGEQSYQTTDRNERLIWIHDFALESFDGRVIEIDAIRQRFEDLLVRVWSGETENDAFNRLVLMAGLNWRQIVLLRAYARYMHQIRISHSQDFIAGTLAAQTDLARLLLQLFETRFDPDLSLTLEQRLEQQDQLRAQITAGLEQVDNISEDRIIRRYVELICATLRTNFYQSGETPKSYISFKFRPADISEMPLPLPEYEIFVYSPRVEGIHLRGGKVARGGLRWSDRLEDYRTEVLGLVKAQQVKNSVIVPAGAKGGFVAKVLPEGDREAWLKEGVACYQMFIRGLLDVTDNLDGETVVPPARVVRHDSDDPYLVVAADKGTATFSDIANALAAEYGFWLGDAFASGGSNGYDHKKMGITARGAWVSVERHFREMGIDTRSENFTVVGIGDMAGDVFGNGMLRSRHIQLVGAFNHMHIFVDPNPDAELSFRERERLFKLPRSSWADYDASLISEGGGIFLRSQKSIAITPQMKERLGITADQLSPNELIAALLKAPVDLIWNGGIGTYVKSSEENNVDVGDKANDAVRVNGRDLRCRVVGEGGNLGMTQRGRIEYALTGGRLNTDFIDNAGGVDCSDHEVNIKIMLTQIVAQGDLTEKQRNQLLADMTDEVADLVLKNNYRQTQALSIAESQAGLRIEEYRRLINELEASGKLNRALEFIPDDDVILERKSRNQGLTRPELAILLSYVKAGVKEALIEGGLGDDDYIARELLAAFPPRLREQYETQLLGHRLRRELVAMQVANNMVNQMGITFVHNLVQSTGASVAAIARAYIVVRDIFDLEKYWTAIEALDSQVKSEVQLRMMNELTRVIGRGCRWVLRNQRSRLDLAENIAKFAEGVREVSGHWQTLLRGSQLEHWTRHHHYLEEQGVPEELAKVIASAPYLYSALGIVDAHQQTGVALQEVADLFFAVGERLELQWFAQQIACLRPATHWQSLARDTFKEDLDWQQRALTVGILQQADSETSVTERIESWAQSQQELIQRWNGMLAELKATKSPEIAMFSVALRELLDLAQSTRHSGTSEDAI